MKEDLLTIACTCKLTPGKACSRASHTVNVRVSSGPLCVARGRDDSDVWMVYHRPTGYAYPSDWPTMKQAAVAMRKMLKIAGEKWWSQKNPGTMAGDKEVVSRIMKLFPRTTSRLS